MKKLLLTIVCVFMVSAMYAQYRIYKKQYDVEDYKYQTTDRYNPTTAGFLSIIPGLGHCSIGEPARGFGFFVLTYGSLVVTGLGVTQVWQADHKDRAGWMVGGGAAMFIGSYIWSIADVTRVAKIKNMHFREKNLSLRLYPSLLSYTELNTLGASIRGATLSINF